MAFAQDVIVHVGDYHYREAPCPADQPGCAKSVSGYNWDAWLQDYFTPIAPALATTPFIHVRGNHELCDRAGEGWFRYLETRPWQEKCVDQMPPYSVTMGDHRWVVFDSADEANITPSAKDPILKDKKPTWVFTHRPVITPDEDPVKEKARAPMVSAVRDIPGLTALFAGHWHVLSLDQFSGKSPLELVVGNGGTQMDPPPHAGKVTEVERRGSYSGQQYYGFGYLRLDRAGPSTWNIVAKDQNGKPVIKCLMNEKTATLKCSTDSVAK
jgi:hypothetical protein